MKSEWKEGTIWANISRAGFVSGVSLLLAVAAIIYIQWAGIQAGRYMQRDILVVLPVVNDAAFHFQPDAAAFLDWEHGYIEVERQSRRMMENGTTIAPGFHGSSAQVTEAGWGYLGMVFMDYSQGGGPWRDEDSVIISEALAWELFGHTGRRAVGLPVRIDDDRLYTVSGVVRDPVASDLAGFAWILREGYGEADAANILYVRPVPYNRLGGHLNTAALLESLGRRTADYTITDVNAYIYSIALRGQILLALTGLFVMWFLLRRGIRLEKSWERGLVTGLGVVAAIFFVWYLDMDLWLPAFAGNGWEGYRQLLFNTGLLGSRGYLPGHLAAVYDWNFRANAAFGVGFIGLLQIFIVQFITTPKTQKGSDPWNT
ncbi:MAG: ABC transporter permease [Defluviitaleaceae bacterium]|nr:ABC transporter permease [Defluviitaleaceae bacterium]